MAPNNALCITYIIIVHVSSCYLGNLLCWFAALLRFASLAGLHLLLYFVVLCFASLLLRFAPLLACFLCFALIRCAALLLRFGLVSCFALLCFAWFALLLCFGLFCFGFDLLSALNLICFALRGFANTDLHRFYV